MLDRIAKFSKILLKESRRLGVPTINNDDALIIYSVVFTYASIVNEGIVAIDAGAGVGYSTLWIVAALESACKEKCKVIAIEKDSIKHSISKELYRKHFITNNVTLEFVNSDAVEYIEAFRNPIDIAFVDIDKSQYPLILKKLEEKIKINGIAMFHNALYPKPPYEFFKIAFNKPWKTTIVPTELGLLIAVRKN